MSQSRRCRIALVQMACGADPEKNLTHAVQAIEEAAAAGAQVVCLPELFRTPYFCQREDTRAFNLAEPIPGPTTEAVGHIARKTGTLVVTPIFERRASGLYHNSVAILDRAGAVAGVYRKMHIPDDPGYYEKFYFTPGDLGFRAIRTPLGPVGVLICWDQWFPEAARLCVLQGAVLLMYPTAIGWHPEEKARHGMRQREAWRTVQRGHAIANGVYVAAVNRVGFECPEGTGGLEFWGSSFLADPLGALVAEASVDREELLFGDVDLDHLEEVRRNWPFLRDRRIEAYAGLDRRFLDGGS